MSRATINMTLLLVLTLGSVMASAAAPTQMTVALCASDVAVDTALFQQDYYAADGTRGKLVIIEAGGPLAACVGTDVQAADILWAGLVPADRLDGRVNHMALQGKFSDATAAVNEIIDTTEAEPPPVSVPAASARPRSDVTTGAQLPTAIREQTRSAWLWSPTLWQDHPDLIWRLQEQQQLSTIYVTVTVTAEGALENAPALAAFIQAATTHDLHVWAVIGDRQDVLAMSRPALQSRLHAYRAYNATTPAEAQLAGVQLDIEPYLLPGFSLAQGIWRERYLDVLTFARAELGPGMALDLVVPAWWGTHPDWSDGFLNRLDTAGLSLTVMNYHTLPARLLDAAEPFLAWGQRAGVPIRMALETGQLSDETRRYYGATENTGDLWLIDVGGTPVLLLLAAPAAGLPGRAFTFADETAVPAATYTFAGDLARLTEVLAEVAVHWERAPAFAGIALHGLDEALPR